MKTGKARQEESQEKARIENARVGKFALGKNVAKITITRDAAAEFVSQLHNHGCEAAEVRYLGL